MQYRRIFGSALLVVGLVACGGNDVTGPGPQNDATLTQPDQPSDTHGASTAAVAGNCAQYVSEGPPYDYDTVPKNSTFYKSWKIKNCGSTTWTTSWWVLKDSGNTCTSFHHTKNTGPGGTGTFWAKCYVGGAGQYYANFYMGTPSKVKFGEKFWVIVNAQ